MESPNCSSISHPFGVAAEPKWEISAGSCSMSEVTSPSRLYANYETGAEAVAGPMCLQLPVAAFVAFVPVNEENDTEEAGSRNDIGLDNTDAALQELRKPLGICPEPQHPEWAALPHFTIDNCGQLVTPSTDTEQIWGPMPDAHMKQTTAHKKQIKYTCKTCHIEFKQLCDYKAHKLSHAEKPYECRTCYKKFSRADNLNRHKLRHSTIKYPCDECQKIFTRFSNLKFHKMIHAGEKPFSCDICKMEFKRSGHLRAHLNSHSGEKPYVCDLCDKKFSRSNHLKEHRRLHDGEKPHVCDVCNKPFARTGTLNKHKRLHTTDKEQRKEKTGNGPFFCEVCSKEFTQRALRDRHQESHV